jgi:predicted ATP-dependent protease
MEMHEAAGISFSIRESRLPLYGYSSRHFDAMARGQVIVQGSLIVNYIHQDYLFRIIESGREQGTGFETVNPNVVTQIDSLQAQAELLDALQNEEAAKSFNNQILSDPDRNRDLIQAMQGSIWGSGAPIFGVAPRGATAIDPTGLNPHDMNSSVQIKITFGARSPFNNSNGSTGLLLSGVHFVSRGVPVRIDEEVIVEEYGFLARNVHTLNSESSIAALPLSSRNQARNPLAISEDPLDFTFDVPGSIVGGSFGNTFSTPKS